MGYVLISGLGNNVGLHRWAGHKSIVLGKYSKNVVLFFSLLACQGPPLWWAAVHRGLHHKHSDTELDPHNPEDGFLHSLVLWQSRLSDGDVKVRPIIDETA